jgi:hypothetical protein
VHFNVSEANDAALIQSVKNHHNPLQLTLSSFR